MLGGAQQGGRIQLDNALFAAFSTPFWLVGFGMLGGVLWSARGTRSVMIDSVELVTELRCLIWQRRRTIDRSRVQYARKGDAVPSTTAPNTPIAMGHFPRYLVELVYEKGSFSLPCDTTAERDWLLNEINEFLELVPSD